jgi:hypothetical protein
MDSLVTFVHFFKYIYRNLQLPYHLIMIKTKVFLPQEYLTIADFGYLVKESPLVFLFHRTCLIYKYCGFERT